MKLDIINLAKALLLKALGVLKPAQAPLPPRPQLHGRRGYGDGSIKRLE